MKISVITAFGDILNSYLQQGVVGSAVRSKHVDVSIVNPRDFTEDIHHTIDDRPFGGGDGMVMMVEPLKKALTSLPDAGRVVYVSPQGRTWTDSLAREWSQDNRSITIICGRYAGVDERFLSQYVHEEISIGDYVLSGGELAALVMIDSMARMVPGVLGNENSSANDSFANGLLEAPLYTRPREAEGMTVPPVLLGGNHAHIKRWRYLVSLLRTQLRRPDLLEGRSDISSKDFSEAQDLMNQLSEFEKRTLGLLDREMRADIQTGPLAVGLVHWPTLDKLKEIVCTNVTNLDIHDIARASRVYNLDRYYIINRQQPQLAFVHRILDHWRTGEGARYNATRKESLTVLDTAQTLEDAVQNFRSRVSGRSVVVVGTSARPQLGPKTMGFRDLRAKMALGDDAYFFVFGTGYGLAPELESQIDIWLEPIRGRGNDDYRHLSVRSAVSICLDRLLGAW